MPTGSSVQEFIDALKTGKTNITKALDNLFGSKEALDWVKEKPEHRNLWTSNVLDSLEPWARNALNQRLGQNLSATEIAHINNWPKDQKEKVRKKLVTAIEKTRRVHFFWELHSGDDEETDIHDPDGTGDIIVTFRSPRKKVDLSAPDEVTVKVA